MSLAGTPLFQRLLLRTPFSERELVVLITTAPTRYKDHYISKRNGRGKRLISQPTKEIKFLQRLIIKYELNGLPIHDAAMAYRTGRATIDHAELHAASRYLLKLDFRDFFPSLKASALNYCLERDTEFSQTERWLISRLLCRAKRRDEILRLSIGAPSSPFLSNYLMYEFDFKLSEFCKARDVSYSRYADDLALSTSHALVLDDIKYEVSRLMEELSYLDISLNEEKTVSVSMKRRRTLVGLTLSNDGNVSIGRDEKRKLRATFHAYHGGKLLPEEVGRLRGMLAYVYGVDPAFVNQMCLKYGVTHIRDIGVS